MLMTDRCSFLVVCTFSLFFFFLDQLHQRFQFFLVSSETKFFFKNYNFIYLLIYGCAGSSLLCSSVSIQLWQVGVTLQCTDLSLQGLLLFLSTGCRPHGLQWLQHLGLVVAVPGFQSTGSVVMLHALSCSPACGIFPDQGSNLYLLHGLADSLPWSHWGKPTESHS